MDQRPAASGAGWPLAAFACWAWACLWYPLTDTDIWWHLASAKLMWVRREFLRTDPFCQSSLGAPWIDLHWGFQLIAYAAWKAGGAAALIAGKCLAVTFAYLLILRSHLDRKSWPWLIPLAALGMYHARFLLDARPLALTLLGLGVQYAATISHLRGRLRQPCWILIPVQAMLANLQGLYPLGALLVSFLALGAWLERRAREGGGIPPLRHLGLTCAAMWAAGLATPWPLEGMRLPLSLFGRIAPHDSNVFSRGIAENLPFPDLAGRDPAAALAFAAIGGFVLWTFWKARRKPAPGHALLFAAFAALGWMAQRNLPLYLLAALAAAGRNLQVSLAGLDGADDAEPRAGRRAAIAGWAALAAVCALYMPALRAARGYELPGGLVTPFRVPAGAVDFLEAHPIPGNIFNELRFGGYLDWRMYPKPAFVDGRMILRSAGFYREFLEVVDQPDGFPAYRARYGFTHALLPIAEDKRFLPLAARLAEAGWPLLYCDGAAVLLAAPEAGIPGLPLDSIPPDHRIPAAISSRFGANPILRAIALRNAAEFLGAAGKARAALDLAAPPP